MADSFQGGVQFERDGRGELRARIALVGSSVEALTGDETFRIPLTRCEVASEGQRIVVRDLEGTMSIWSDEDQFLDRLGRTRSDALTVQVERIRSARFRRRAITWSAKALVAAIIIGVIAIPLSRWAVGGGVQSITDQIGQSALQELHLPAGQAPVVERRLTAMAEQLQPAAALGKHNLRVLLADYDDAHTFHLPPDVVVVTSTLVCNAEESNLVIAAIALELAHLEARDLNAQANELVDWRTSLDVLSGNTTKLRDYMLDFADSRRSPGYAPDREAVAKERATTIMKEVVVPLESRQDIAALLERAKAIPSKREGAGPLQPEGTENEALRQWAEIRAEACDIVGR